MDSTNSISLLLYLVSHVCNIQYVICSVSHLYFSFTEYGVVNRGDSVLFIGGFCADSGLLSLSSRIAQYSMSFNSDSWEEVGNLQSVRGDHRAIANGDRFYVIGGYNDSNQAL